MSQSSHGNMLLQGLRGLAVAILKVSALLIGWLFKILALLFTWASEVTFKLSER